MTKCRHQLSWSGLLDFVEQVAKGVPLDRRFRLLRPYDDLRDTDRIVVTIDAELDEPLSCGDKQACAVQVLSRSKMNLLTREQLVKYVELAVKVANDDLMDFIEENR